MDPLSGTDAESLEVVCGVDEGFCVKKLEMVACLRFRGGDGAEGDWEEWGAMMIDSPDDGTGVSIR